VPTIRQISLCLWACGCCVPAVARDVDTSTRPPAATNQVDFARDVRPILEGSCLRCHGPEKPRSGFRLDNRQAALKGGDGGVDIIPGKSAASPLIHYVAGLVEDMEMPPTGKGEPLTKEQIATLRAWIDQGAVWSATPPSNHVEVAFSPVVGGAIVSGDKHKFREQYWEKDGVNGGEEFEMSQATEDGTQSLLAGHAFVNDYRITLAQDQSDLGFVHSGWEQYRKYYDDLGVYYPPFMPRPLALGEDLHLDIGKAWIDFGLTLPDWPRMVLGYEYDYRHGNEATTQWGAVAKQGKTVNIAPASKNINEAVNIIKFDLDAEVRGVTIAEQFRGEFYHLTTGQTNTVLGEVPQRLNEGSSYFQGANTLRAERKFNDWLYGSAGYLYSKLNGDSDFGLQMPTVFQSVSAPQITLGRESHVGNLNAVFGPFDGLTIGAGAQAEWTRQHSLGAGALEVELPPPFSIPFEVASDYDKTSVQENLSLHYTKIPFTALFAEGRFEQQKIGQYDQFASEQDILNKAVFLQNTAFSARSSDLRAGFSTSPWRTVSLTAHYRRYEDDSHYNSDALVQPAPTAYPTFIRARELLTDEVETRLVVSPWTGFKTSLTYQYRTTDYTVDTRPFVLFGTVISPGGELSSGEYNSQTYSVNATLTPAPRVRLSTTFYYETSTTVTPNAGSPAIVPYHGYIYSVLAGGVFVLTRSSDLNADYLFSDANYGQDNFAGGVPMGVEYQRHVAQIGLSHRFTKRLSTKLQYRFDYYEEPSSGGAANYRAHTVFGMLTFQFY